MIFSRENIRDEWFSSYSKQWLTELEGVRPSSYLEFANQDLADGRSPRHLINAVSNAKRALHLEVETLCNKFGRNALNKKRFDNFPNLLRFIEKCGIVDGRIFNKINGLRNLVEHQYVIPSDEEAENFIDVVDLFLRSTKMLRSSIPYDIVLIGAIDDSKKFSADFLVADFQKGQISIKISSLEDVRQRFTKEIDVNEEEYFIWTAAILRNNY